MESFLSLPDLTRDQAMGAWAFFFFAIWVAIFLFGRMQERRVFARVITKHPGAWDLYGKPRGIGRGNNALGLAALLHTREHRWLNDACLSRRIYAVRTVWGMWIIWSLIGVGVFHSIGRKYEAIHEATDRDRDAIAAPLYP